MGCKGYESHGSVFLMTRDANLDSNPPTFSIRDWSDGKDENKTKHNFCIHMFTLRQHAYAFTSAINGCIILTFFSNLNAVLRVSNEKL